MFTVINFVHSLKATFLRIAFCYCFVSCVSMLVKSYESIEYSYIGRADFFLFFQEKVLKFVHAQFLFFAV